MEFYFVLAQLSVFIAHPKSMASYLRSFVRNGILFCPRTAFCFHCPPKIHGFLSAVKMDDYTQMAIGIVRPTAFPHKNGRLSLSLFSQILSEIISYQVQRRGYCFFRKTPQLQGLLLFRKTPQLCVCNPLMRIYAEIEVDLTDKFIHIVGRGNKEPYLVVCSDSKNFSFRVYHYFQDSWKIRFQFAGETRSDIFGDEMVECNGVLFWKAWTPRIIVGYNIEDDLIKPVTIAPSPRELVDDRGGVYALGIVAYGSSVLVINLGMGIVIWELFQDDEDKLLWKWKEFARMPPHSLPRYLDGEWWHQKAVYLAYLTSVEEAKDFSRHVFLQLPAIQDETWHGIALFLNYLPSF